MNSELDWCATEITDDFIRYYEKCSDPNILRELDRKFRLVSCAICRRLFSNISDFSGLSQCLRVAELFADGDTDREDLIEADTRAREYYKHPLAKLVYSTTLHFDRYGGFNSLVAILEQPECSNIIATTQCIKDIFTNTTLQMSKFDTNLLWVNDALVYRIASTIYQHSRFDRCPELAKALAQAGYNNPDLIGHLLSHDSHYLGCWALDYILNKDGSRYKNIDWPES
jgi:hypothetical protein